MVDEYLSKALVFLHFVMSTLPQILQSLNICVSELAHLYTSPVNFAFQIPVVSERGKRDYLREIMN